ncbi:MAG TPA: arginine--tRNA ligase [Acidimicrobiales bacterium]|nr:arginine--tRNA ligase [Acidimicrobiales bacterium]
MAPTLLRLLHARVDQALYDAFGPTASTPEILVQPTRDPRHGDFSCPAPMALARTLRRRPDELALRLATVLDVTGICEAPEVAPPGFVNLRLRRDWLEARIGALVGDEGLGVGPVARPRRIVIDYSGPNVAKEMHVGHLRSTIIGDCLANVAQTLGHDVHRVSHVGDWGTQFGMLIAHLDDVLAAGEDHPERIADAEVLYREASARFREDMGFRDRARRRVVDLQSGEGEARATWQSLVDLSTTENAKVYELLGVKGLVNQGESTYQPVLAQIVADLEAGGLVVVDDGAKCVFVPGFTNIEGEPLPLIVQKADGAYNYATTDLAALRSRVEEGAEELLYVADAGQSQHFQMVFAVARMAGWLPKGVEARHVAFGLVLGEDGQRLRTRSGDNVRLADLLEEALARARAFVAARAQERVEDVPEDIDEVARVVGLGAVRYADLSQNRQSNYVFSFDRMLSLKGNTAPYLQYAYARIRSILREADWIGRHGSADVALAEPQERALAVRLVMLADVVERVAAEQLPSLLCTHLYELSQAYSQFYEHCPVLRADEPVRTSRLALCQATATALSEGLGLLGIEVLERI